MTPSSRSGRSGHSAAAAPPRHLGRRWLSVDFGALLIVLLACVLGGGTAFADTSSLLYVRPVAVLAIVTFMLTPAPIDWPVARTPLALLACLALIMVAQLLPLPPSVWFSLPGHEQYAPIANLAGVPQPWRPLSLTPDLTMNSLAALVIPAAVLIGFAKVEEGQRSHLIVAMVGLCCASATLGVAQFASGEGSALYLYRRTYEGLPVGFLSNRNHQAALLALIFPCLRVWLMSHRGTPRAALHKLWLALAAAALCILVVLATGSRAGMAVTGVSLAATLLAFPRQHRLTGEPPSPLARWLRVVIPAALLLLIAVSYLFGRAVSIQRLSAASSIAEDQRFQYAPVVLRIVKTTFPVGTGFGSFDPVFRQYEPDAYMISTFFNHAHNELLELAMTAGLAGLLLLAAFLLWWARQMVSAWRGRASARRQRTLVLLGGIATGLLLGASLVAYPLRTPLLSAVFALACGWLATPTSPPSKRVSSR